MKDWKDVTRGRQDRIAFTLLGKSNFLPAEFHRAIQNILPTISTSHELAAQTNAQNGLIATAELAYKLE